MGDRPHFGVGNAYFFDAVSFRGLLAATASIEDSCSKLQGIFDRKEVCHFQMPSLSRFNGTNLGWVIVLKAESVRGEERRRLHSLWV
jgi:hypothetical protein